MRTHGESKDMIGYQQRAQALAQKVTAEWQHFHADDVRGLADAVHRAFVDEANLELRQILAQLYGQLELAHARATKGAPAMTPEKIQTLLGALERASVLMDVYMDRSAAAKMIIQIDAQEFDLAHAFDEYLLAHGIRDRVDAALLASPVIADRPKLMDALGHLITRFYFAAGKHERVLLQCAVVDGRVEGFIGLSPSHLAPEQLMEEMRVPLAVEDVGIDVGYARAIVERHGGALFVATAGDASAGFGFHLPLLGGAA
ncbi:MAG TPA: hypothetical protein VM582_01755 [Candidatus Thermoplasmatota archaeon]|nr:hypothetical protein [Candidatus Thermoplasmatota archaeon]